MRVIGRLILLVVAIAFPIPAFAHHAMGGATPTTFFQGFLSGLAHPILGPEHLFFLVVVGLLARSRGPLPRPAIPVLVVLGALAGTTLYLAGVQLSGIEMLIASSLALCGLLLLFRHPRNVFALSVFLSGSGLFHGYAYAESIVGAQSGSLVGYLMGLALIQILLIAGIARGLTTSRALARRVEILRAERFAGGLAILGGLAWLAVDVLNVLTRA